MQRIPFIKPFFPASALLAEDIERIHKNNYYTNNGPVYFEFKEEIEKFLGQGIHAVVLSNATTALLLAIKALGKDESKKTYIAVPSFTFPAGPLAVKWCGYKPIFFDIEAGSAQPSIESFKTLHRKFGNQLACVLLVNNFGIGNPKTGQWEELCARHGLPLIIDSAPGLGSVYPDGELLGGRGNCEVFSLHATKPFGIGEGGLLTTKDAELAKRIESLKNFGFDENKVSVSQGINAKITEFDCAIGLRLLKEFEKILTKRKNVHKEYEKNLESTTCNFLPNASSAAIQFVTLVVNPSSRDKIIAELSKNGIDARTYYAPPVNEHPLFKEDLSVDLSATRGLSRSVVSLPVHFDMTPKTINRICSIIKECL